VRFSPAEGVLDTIHEDVANHTFHARLVAPRPEPDGRSSTVRPESPTGKLFSLDVYEADPVFSALTPRTAKTVRVIEGLPLQDPPPLSAVSTTYSSRMYRRLLGEAPVEEDGSFHIDVPANLPVQLQLLDSDGLALASCDWIWVKQREFRGCIGCHEDPELTPPNRFVQAARRPATELTPPPDQRRTISFLEQVIPILETRCAECHQDGETGLALGELDNAGGGRSIYNRLLGAGHPEAESSEIQLRALVEPGRARTSPLIWRLLGRNTSRPWDRQVGTQAEIPADHVEILTQDEMTVLIEWVDLGAQWTSDPNQGAPQ
jgi:hypothetical protein